METIAFIDCSAGVAGDMLLGALIDAGAPLEDVVKGLSSLRAIEGEWALRTTKVWQGPGRIAGTKVHVDSIYKHKEAAPPVTPAAAAVAAPIESHAHDHSHDHSHYHDHSHSHSHDHSHDHRHDHSHEASELVAVGVLDPKATTEHCHEHGHNHSHGGDGEDGGEPMRNLDDIKQMILTSTLSEWVKTQSIAVFTLLAQAEAHTHGTTLEAIHFHEVGAIDSIVDTVGCVLAMDLLGVRQVYSSFLPFSSGTVKCMHGILPVPPPATFRLMIGIPVCPAPKGAKGELVTPTGVSLVKALSTAFGEPPAFIPTHTGVGAGTKEFPFHANIVRVAIGTKVDPNAMAKVYLNPSAATAPASSSAAVEGSASLVTKAQPTLQQQESQYSEEDVVVLETNLDDLNPQVVGFVLEKLLNEKLALDVWTQPIQMKKSRPGICLSVLCQPEREASVLQVLFQETTTLGVRKKMLQRVFLRREFIKIHAFERRVAVKLAFYGDKLVNIYPEYEECKEIAKDTGTPLLDVIHKVQSLATTFIESQ